MELRLKKEEYVDFVRSITPLIVDLFEIILKKQCKIDINDYCNKKREDGKERRRIKNFWEGIFIPFI